MAWGRRGGQRTSVRIDMKGSGVLLLNLRRDDGGFFAEDIDMSAFSCHPTGVISTLGKSCKTYFCFRPPFSALTFANRNFGFHLSPSLLFQKLLVKIFIFTMKSAIISKDKPKGSGKMFSYEGLNERLRTRGINKSDLTSLLGISSRTIAKIAKGEKISAKTMKKIADYLACAPKDLYRKISDNVILQILRDEKEARISGGLYHELQVRMTYNSNHIEGSKLSEEQTRLIFETNTIDVGDGIPVDDILETVHHFRAIDYVIDVAEEELSEEIIKHLHYILKHDTADSRLSWFAVGDYKRRANMVGGRETAKPKDVPGRMKGMLEAYNAKKDVTIEDVIALHADFEYIHPFQDGNGRVGRLVSLKECLRHDIVPFIIEDAKKAFYYRGLSEWQNEKGWLTDTCLDGQDTFKRLMEMLEIVQD